MRLLNFRIRNYKSIIDSGLVTISESDNLVVFAGQNESGKSSLLKALHDFERASFDDESIPFSRERSTAQVVTCTYKIEARDDLARLAKEMIAEKMTTFPRLSVATGFEWSSLDRLKTFTLTRSKEREAEDHLDIDESAFNIFRTSIQFPPNTLLEGREPSTEEVLESLRTLRIETALLFHLIAPMIVLFDSQCDLLPSKILISALAESDINADGFRAVKNLEAVLGTDFVQMDREVDAIRDVREEDENEELRVNFQKDWGQRIHEDNEVIVKYQFEKREGVGEAGSYVNFYVQTKEGVRLSPKQRSKGLIWFLSLWLELKAQDREFMDLVLLLDEPDQHLHVKAQKDILNLLNKLGLNHEGAAVRQIIYATHSPYLIDVQRLNRIKLVVNSKSDGTKVEDLTTSRFESENKRDALQPVANAIGYHISELSPYGRRNVILEGISDFYYFSGMKILLDPNGEYAFIPGIGVRKLNGLISHCIGYGLEWLAILDSDPSHGGKDSRSKFDEIRDYLFDGDAKATSERIMILNGVVGVENMFTLADLRLIESISGNYEDMTKAVGKNRKVLFSKSFLDKVNNKEIEFEMLSEKAKANFQRSFEFISRGFDFSSTNHEDVGFSELKVDATS